MHTPTHHHRSTPARTHAQLETQAVVPGAEHDASMADAAVAGMGSEFDAEQRLADETRQKQEKRLMHLKKELKAAEKGGFLNIFYYIRLLFLFHTRDSRYQPWDH